MKQLKKSEINWLPVEEGKQYPIGFYYVTDNPVDEPEYIAGIDLYLRNWKFYAPVFNFPKWRNPMEAGLDEWVLLLSGSNIGTGFRFDTDMFYISTLDNPEVRINISKIDGYLPISELVDLIQAPDPIEEKPEEEIFTASIPVAGKFHTIKLRHDPNDPKNLIIVEDE